jgi:hypothetical protein
LIKSTRFTTKLKRSTSTKAMAKLSRSSSTYAVSRSLSLQSSQTMAREGLTSSKTSSLTMDHVVPSSNWRQMSQLVWQNISGKHTSSKLPIRSSHFSLLANKAKMFKSHLNFVWLTVSKIQSEVILKQWGNLKARSVNDQTKRWEALKVSWKVSNKWRSGKTLTFRLKTNLRFLKVADWIYLSSSITKVIKDFSAVKDCWKKCHCSTATAFKIDNCFFYLLKEISRALIQLFRACKSVNLNLEWKLVRSIPLKSQIQEIRISHNSSLQWSKISKASSTSMIRQRCSS